MSISRHHLRRGYRGVFPSVFVVVAALGWAGTATAEDNFLTESPTPTVKNPPRLYLTLASGVAPNIGPTGMAELTVGGEHLQLTGRFGIATGISLLGPPESGAGELGLLTGYGQSLGPAHFYAAVGMGMIRVQRRGPQLPSSVEGWSRIEYQMLEETVFNIPLQVGVDFGRRIAGVGLAFVANLNSSMSYAGVLLTVNLGKLRSGM